MVIAHNILAMNAQRQYGVVTSDKAKTTEKLSSGYKINRAADDAAGLSISEKMRSLIRGLDRGSDNIQDGISLVQIADGELAEVNDMLHRITELSVQSANGTNSESDRAAIQKEVSQIIAEIDRIHTTAKFNETYLFDGTDIMPAGDGDDFGNLVECKSVETGRMTEAYQIGSKWRPAAILDFSSINIANVGQLVGKDFSFSCSQSCSESFKFTFVNDDTPSSWNSETKNQKTAHEYTINIKGCTKGSEVIRAIYNYVENNAPWGKGAYKTSLPEGVAVSHSNGMTIDGKNKLVIYSDSVCDSKEAAEAKFKNASGNTAQSDASKLIGKANGMMKQLRIQCSNAVNDAIYIKLERMDSNYLGITDIDLSTQEGALDALDAVSVADARISAMRSRYGAYQNRMEHSYANNQNKMENTQAAESLIRDTDMAKEMVKFTKNNILSQAGEAMMTQANQSKQGVLSLLQ